VTARAAGERARGPGRLSVYDVRARFEWVRVISEKVDGPRVPEECCGHLGGRGSF